MKMKWMPAVFGSTVLFCLLPTVVPTSASTSRDWKFLLAVDMALNDKDAFGISYNESHCICKTRCFVLPRCKAFSSVRGVEGNTTCLLTEKDPTQTILERRTDAVYGFYGHGLDGYFQRGDDGLYYLVSNIATDLPQAQEYCRRIPGFRMAIFRTQQQFEIGWNIVEASGKGKARINLLSSDGWGPLYWGDGTPYPLEFANFTDTQNWHMWMALHVAPTRMVKDAGVHNETFMCQGQA